MERFALALWMLRGGRRGATGSWFANAAEANLCGQQPGYDGAESR